MHEQMRSIHAELDILTRAYEDYTRKYPPQIRNSMELFAKVQSAIYTKEKELEECENEK